MPVYEIINPSDAYTISGDLLPVALATLLLGDGRYALRSEDGESVLPLFLFGGEDVWVSVTFGQPLAELWRDTPKQPVVAALRSVLIGEFAERRDYEAAVAAIDEPEKRAAFAAGWHERHRSSMNDIGARAHSLADALEAKYCVPA